MVPSVPRLLLALLFVGLASAARAEVCITIDESRDTFAPRDRSGALVLLTTQFEREGERVVAAGCADAFVLVHSQLGNLTIVTVSGRGKSWQATAQTTEDVPAIYSQIARSIVTGRSMTGLSVVDRTNVTSAQAEARRVHSDSIWYGRLGYGGVFAGDTYGTPSLGFGYRAELDTFAIDLAFLNLQLPSPGGYASPRAFTTTWLKLSGLRFVNPHANRSAYFGGGLSYGHTNVTRGGTYSPASTYRTSASGNGLQGELTAGYELARATSLRMFVQADVVLPFYQVTSETYSMNGPISSESQYAPSLVLSVGIGR
jgi:hypothetical protein